MIKLLIVDDSPVAQIFLNYIYSKEPDIQVIGIAKDGKEAIELTESNKPDVISMDIHMPGLNGFETTRKIMETNPTPIVIVSGISNVKDISIAFQSIEAGALATVARPQHLGHPEFDKNSKELIQTIKLMSEIKVVRRWPNNKKHKKLTALIKKINIGVKQTNSVFISESFSKFV